MSNKNNSIYYCALTSLISQILSLVSHGFIIFSIANGLAYTNYDDVMLPVIVLVVAIFNPITIIGSIVALAQQPKSKNEYLKRIAKTFVIIAFLLFIVHLFMFGIDITLAFQKITIYQ